MDLQINNKLALVSASTAGIGFAIAKLLAQEGATVVINGRTEQRVQEAIKQIKAEIPSANLMPAVADLATVTGIDQIIKAVPEVDILINNLGIYEVKEFARITDEEWQHMFDVNVMSGVRLSRHYFPSMLKKNWGRIIFISSESGVQIPSEMIHYGMTKAAQIAIARGLAEASAGSNVTVNSVLPGPTRSEGVAEFIKGLAKMQNKPMEQLEKEFISTGRPTSIIKRLSTPEEVANLVAYLCSPLASSTNGDSVRVDGGVIRSAY